MVPYIVLNFTEIEEHVVFESTKLDKEALLVQLPVATDVLEPGHVIAENAKPAAFKGRVLLVHVNSSPWIHQLQFLKTDMINNINQHLGDQLVDEIKFKIGTF